MKQFIPPVLLIVSFLNNSSGAFCQKDSVRSYEEIVLKTETGMIYGSLSLPLLFEPVPMVLMISGSGPTDRDGNNPMMRNNSLKMLSDSLFSHGISSVRYDKRGICQSRNAGIREEDIRFETYVNDAVEWIKLLQTDKRFSKIIILGHSEGSLIGMIGAKKANADGFISIAGAGESSDKILKNQLKQQPQGVIDMTYPIIDSLIAGKIVKNVFPMLNPLFRESVQPYLISWFKYDPFAEINKLSMPILVVQGTNDLQVRVKDAELLASGNKNAKLILIEGMNHIFKESNVDTRLNIATYSNPDLPINSQLVIECVQFINSLK